MNTSPPTTLPARDPRGHKGTFGVVSVIGGCASPGSFMLGGPCLSAIAALRAGCGLVRLALPAPILPHGLVIAPSATGVALPVDSAGDIIAHEAAAVVDGLLAGASCVVAGPGLGVSSGAQAVSLRVASQTETPVVLDADALNNLAATSSAQLDFHASAILTPHPGEFSRLAASLSVAGDPTDASTRPAACAGLAQKLGCIVVLKGANTVVSDGHQTWVHACADSALATAGTGDVLAGVIASLVAQQHKRPLGAGARAVTSEQQGGLSLFDCARLGVIAHASAASVWRARHGADAGLLARELADCLPQAMQSLRAAD